MMFSASCLAYARQGVSKKSARVNLAKIRLCKIETGRKTEMQRMLMMPWQLVCSGGSDG